MALPINIPNLFTGRVVEWGRLEFIHSRFLSLPLIS